MMKITLISFLFFLIQAQAQVGINTPTPGAMLDINGDLKISTIIISPDEQDRKDNILVTNNIGIVKKSSSKDIVNSYLKTTIKGSFFSSAPVNLSLISSAVKIPFDSVEFDTNTEFDISTNTFTAKQDGIYSIKVQIKSDAAVGATTNFGVATLKNGVVFSQNSFANISVAGINVSPPIRSLDTLVQLITGDTINFNIISDLLNVTILGNSEDCFFSIQQIK
jgi:hypothetical protein